MVRRLLGTLVALVALASTSLMTAGAAQAAWDACPKGWACIWGDADYETKKLGNALLKFQYSYENFGRGTYPGTSINGNDTASSVVNNGRVSNAHFYYHNNCDGYVFTLQPGGERDPNLSNGIDTRTNPYVGSVVNDNLTGGRFEGQKCLP